MIDFEAQMLTSVDLDEHLHLLLAGGNREIPIATAPIEELAGQQTSDLLWFPTDEIVLRSSRLRPTSEPSKTSTPENPEGYAVGKTGSIHTIARTFARYSDFQGTPPLFRYECIPGNTIPVPVLYEGRHRGVAAGLAGRSFILGRMIGPDHSVVVSQNLPTNLNYFGKPMYTLHQLTEMHRHNPHV
ncbi:MAG: hypothetical protein Q7S65_06095 [Nanoarchaeota archaeon]|nr:hypothetical protein [Nanoarchaeota archaeon]